MRSWLKSSPLRVLLLLASGVISAGPARAQAPANTGEGLHLDLTPGATCLADDSLRERLLHWLPVWPDDSALRLEVHGSTHDPRTVVLRLHRRAPGDAATATDVETLVAERRFSPGPPRCGDLHDAVAIAASLMVKAAYAPSPAPEAPAEEPPAEPEAPEPPPAAPTDEPITFAAPLPHQQDPSPAPEVERRPPTKLSFVPRKRKPIPRGHPYLSAQALFGLDVGASPGGGARLQAGIPLGQGFEARLGGLALVSRVSDLEGSAGRYRTKLLSGAIDLCRRFPTASAVEIRLCAGFLPAYLRATGFNFAMPLGVSLFWPAISAELELAIRLTKETLLRLSLAPVYALREAQLVARDPDSAVVGSEDIPRLGVMFGIGFAYEILRQGSTDSEHQSL